MQTRFRLFRRASGVFYVEDTTTLRQESLKTKDKTTAQRLFQAKNAADEQPALNLQLARTYLAASDPEVAKRTWRVAMDAVVTTKSGATRDRWERAVKDHAFDRIRDVRILETRAEHLLAVLDDGTVATNVFLRRLHNFALDMNWLPWPVIPKRQWPGITFKPKRAITFAEHADIVGRERNPEKRAFYQLLWHLGGSQGEIANLIAENINWANRVISYRRQKTDQTALLHFGDQVEAVLRTLPTSGPLFPYLRTLRASDRPTEFKQRCRRLGISGVTLHSYRYGWAERAKAAGYPERYAMEALGHNSMAVHRAYAKNAHMSLPALEEYEKAAMKSKLIRFPVDATVVAQQSCAKADGTTSQ
jgi:integrase